jgi:molecular chaperone GrpE
MSDPKNHDDSGVGTVDGRQPGDETGAEEARERATAPQDQDATTADPAAAADQEVDILRSELARTQELLGEAQREAAEYRDRYLRGRAELETFRRRVAGDVELAREAGLDSAVLAVLTVFDDLGRALQAAESTDDPSTIVPGVRAVKDSLERTLETLDIRSIGAAGEPFDPHQHEALTAVPLADGAEPGTIADVFQAGFKRGDRLVRPARVVVYKEPEDG